MDDKPAQEFLRCDRESYGDSFTSDLLEQYKLYVRSAESVSSRRIASSRYLLTLNVALVALYGLQSSTLDSGWWTILIPVLGIPVSILWHRIIRSHKNLNDVKFRIIHELEERLPAALYAYEWRLANEGRGKPYRSVTDIERWIPLAFVGLHFVLFVIFAGAAVRDCAL